MGAGDTPAPFSSKGHRMAEQLEKTDARQGFTGRRGLLILVASLALAAVFLVVFLGWGYKEAAQVTSPDNAPAQNAAPKAAPKP